MRRTSKKLAVTRAPTSSSGSAPGSRSVGVASENGRHRFEHLLLNDPIEVVLGLHASDGLGIGGPAARRRPGPLPAAKCPTLPDGDEPVVLVERQPAKNHGIDDRKDRRRRADAERQHQQRNHRESRRRAQRPNGISQIGHDASQNETASNWPGGIGPVGLAERCQISRQDVGAPEFSKRRLPSDVGICATSHKLAPAVLEVLRQLFDDLGFARGRQTDR